MFKSAERIKLEAALAAATNPSDIVAVSKALHDLTLREERRASRRRKKREAKEKAWPPPVDENDPFWSEVLRLEADRKPVVIDIPLPPATFARAVDGRVIEADSLEGLEAKMADAAPEPPRVELQPVPAELPAPDGYTITRSSFGPPHIPDSPSCGLDAPVRFGGAGLPWSPVDGFTYTIVDENGQRRVTNQREQREERLEREKLRDYARQMGWSR
jgi:hypothetical protein